jgi:hypothetical protein
MTHNLQMSYDCRPDDLERILIALELAALSLTSSPESSFTEQELLAELRSWDEEIDEHDAKLVLKRSSSVRRIGNKYQLR